MKTSKRLISGVLSLLMLCSLCLSALPAAAQAASAPETGPAGSIGLTLRFDLPQKAENAAGRDITLQVTGGGKDITVPLPEGTEEIPVEVDNQDGVPLTNEEAVGYYKVTLTGLPAGQTYEVKLAGKGYRTFAQSVTLDGYSKHLIVGTGDGTFSLGDVNADGMLTRADLDAMSKKLGGTDPAFDLNGDGKVDITDLTYVNHNAGVTGAAEVKDTAAIVSAAVEAPALILTDASDNTDQTPASAADLFRDGGRDVKVAPSQNAGQDKKELSLPISFGVEENGAEKTVEMEQIAITSPDGKGAVEAGTAEVTYIEDGTEKTENIPFGAVVPEGVHATGRTAGEKVVTINLGRKVAVKKVTIQITAVQDSNGGVEFAVVRKIEFLKDIVPENPKKEQITITSATPAGDGSIALQWTRMLNITGYEIDYWMTEKPDLVQHWPAGSTSATVTGLTNLKPYQFQVRAVNGEWSSAPSPVVSATPQPGSVPGAPSNISVTSADQSLRVSWGKTKDADRYQVFYRVRGESEFTQFGSTLMELTSATITGLTNDTEYEVAVKAGNSKGFGPYSAIALGTPNKEALEMPDLPEEGRIDNSTVTVTAPNNVHATLCPNFTPEHVIDNDASTYWIAATWSRGARFTYTFDQPQDMNYAILVPYLGGNYKYGLKSYNVIAKNSSGETVLEAKDGGYPFKAMDDKKNYLVLTFPMVKDVKELSIDLSEHEGRGGRSISDMAFYKSDTLAEDIAGLFADNTFTTLGSDVTAPAIEALSARLEAKADFYLDLDHLRDELKLAQALLSEETPAVRQGYQSRNGGFDSQYGQGASDLQPLGVSARAGATVAVYASIPDDKPVYVVPTQFYGESGIWRGTATQLVNGRNYITVPKIGSLADERGGPLYLTYAGSTPEEIKLQIRVDKNSFQVPVLELSGWYTMDESARRAAISTYVNELQTYVTQANITKPGTDVRNATEISTPSVLLSIPASQALSGLKGVNRTEEEMVQAMYDDVLAWEDELFVANKVQGIIPSDTAIENYQYPMTTRQNIRYMRMFAGAFMYAAGNHVGIGFGSTTGMVCGRPASATGQGNANSLFGWGIAHEIGHNMDKLGKAEITNNIYSLAIQAYDGGSMVLNTRLTNSNIWKGIYDKTSAGRPGAAGNVFVQLGMYWQLHLAYDSADRPLDFFNQFFTAWKRGDYNQGYTYDERVALIASQTAGKDLTEFFTRWGMTLGQAAREQIAQQEKEERAVWYLNDESYRLRLSGTQGNPPTATVRASVNENAVTLAITGEGKHILGYEIYRNGKSIAFTTESTYTDDLGPANNLTYAYTVRPVDQLGNVGAAASAGEVRIAYDKTIDPALYDLSRDGDGVVTITMKDQGQTVPVTGVKITGAQLSGNYTVEVTAGGENWTTALTGGEATAFFTKPGADSGDNRIWTYDAAAVRITGLPEDAQVALLDYPGDRVDFYEGAIAGTLASDYTYTDADGVEQTIAAGTLVITGTYRGDPVYNFVEIEGSYDATGEVMDEEDGSTASSVKRSMIGYSLLFAEIPADGAVSDISDGIWIFVPDMEEEKNLIEALNRPSGVGTGSPAEDVTGQGAGVRYSPMEIRAVFYRTDDPEDPEKKRETSTTLWVTYPDYNDLPQIELKTDGGTQ